MTAFAFPAIVINAFNQGEISSITLAQTTLAGLAPSDSASLKAVLIPNPRGGAPIRLERNDVARLYSLCDLGASLVFFFAILYNYSFSKREARQVDKASTTAADYTVFLPWVPRDTTEADLREHFKRVTSTDLMPSGSAIADVHVVEDNTAVVSIFVERGRVYRQIERLNERVGRLEDRVRHGDVGITFCCGGNAGKVHRLKTMAQALRQRAEKLSQRATLKASKGSLAAFVTFEEQTAVDYVLSVYPQTITAWCCQRRARMLKNRRIEVLQAPPPASILWGNLAVGACEQRARQTFTSLLTAVFLVGSFILLWFASYQQSQYLSSQQATDCSTPAMLARINAGLLNATYASTLRQGHPDLQCFCGTVNWNAISWVNIEKDPMAPKCADLSCPAYFAGNPAGITSLDYCIDFIQSRAITITLTIAASFVILGINSFLGIVMRLLTTLEAHKSFDDLNASLTLRLFFAQFFNTALLMILVNVAWPGTAEIPEQFKTGKWPDLTVGWYTTVGVQILVTMIINCFTPHIYVIFASICHYRSMRAIKDAPSQRDMNERFIGPYKDWSMRYAQLAMVMTVCIVFSTGMPLLIPIAFVAFFISYWIDKMMFLWYYRRPPAFGSNVQDTFVSLMPLALILHLAWGAWAISYGPLLDWSEIDPLRVQQLAGLAARVVDSYAGGAIRDGASRLTKLQALPLFVFFLIMVVTFTLRVLLGSVAKIASLIFHFLTCNYCARVKFEATSAAEAMHLPTYTEACDPKNTGRTSGMVGLPSYNLLLNPEIMSAFAISPEWAATHKTLSEVALYKIGNASMKSLPVKDPEAGTAHSAAQDLAIARAREAQRRADQVGDDLGDDSAGFDYSGLNTTLRSLPDDSEDPYSTGRGADRRLSRISEADSAFEDDGMSRLYSRDEIPSRFEDDNALDYDAVDDQEFGGYMAGIPPAITASSRRLNVSRQTAVQSYRSGYGEGNDSSAHGAVTNPLQDVQTAALPTAGEGVTVVQHAALGIQAAILQVLHTDSAGRTATAASQQASMSSAMLMVLRDQLAALPAESGRFAELRNAITCLATYVTLESMNAEASAHRPRTAPPPPPGSIGVPSLSPTHAAGATGASVVERAARAIQETVAQILGVPQEVDASGRLIMSSAQQATTAAALLLLMREQLGGIPAESGRYAELRNAVNHLSTYVTLEAMEMEASAHRPRQAAPPAPPASSAVRPLSIASPPPRAKPTPPPTNDYANAAGAPVSPSAAGVGSAQVGQVGELTPIEASSAPPPPPPPVNLAQMMMGVAPVVPAPPSAPPTNLAQMMVGIAPVTLDIYGQPSTASAPPPFAATLDALPAARADAAGSGV